MANSIKDVLQECVCVCLCDWIRVAKWLCRQLRSLLFCQSFTSASKSWLILVRTHIGSHTHILDAKIAQRFDRGKCRIYNKTHQPPIDKGGCLNFDCQHLIELHKISMNASHVNLKVNWTPVTCLSSLRFTPSVCVCVFVLVCSFGGESKSERVCLFCSGWLRSCSGLCTEQGVCWMTGHETDDFWGRETRLVWVLVQM